MVKSKTITYLIFYLFFLFPKRNTIINMFCKYNSTSFFSKVYFQRVIAYLKIFVYFVVLIQRCDCSCASNHFTWVDFAVAFNGTNSISKAVQTFLWDSLFSSWKASKSSNIQNNKNICCLKKSKREDIKSKPQN